MSHRLAGNVITASVILFGLTLPCRAQAIREVVSAKRDGSVPVSVAAFSVTEAPVNPEVQRIKFLVAPPPAVPPSSREPLPSMASTSVSVPNTTVGQESTPAFIQLPPDLQPVVSTDVSPVARRAAVEVREMVPPSANYGYTLACSSCQGIAVHDGNAAVFPAKGTMFGIVADGSVKLAQGRLLTVATNHDINLAAGIARVLVSAGSSAVVEAAADGTARVYLLSSTASAHGAVKLRPAQGPALELTAGQVAVLSSHGLSDEELIAADGIDSQPIVGSVAAELPENVRIRQFSLGQMLEKNLLIGCVPTAARPSTKVGRALKALHEQLRIQSGFAAHGDLAPLSKPIKLAALSRELRPVDMKTGVALPVGHSLVGSNEDTVVAVSNDASVEKRGRHELIVQSGSVLVSSTRQFNISAHGTNVSIKHDACVLVSVNEHSVRVVSLHEGHNDSVKVSHAGSSVPLGSGWEVFLSDVAPSLNDLYNVHAIGRRCVHTHELGHHGWITWSEVSLADVLAHHPLLSSIRSTGSAGLKKQIIRPILYTAAALNVVSARRGAYTQATHEEDGIGQIVAAR